jgi:UDP-glucose 4-epimerase
LARFVGRALNGLPPVIFGDGSNGRDFTYVTEIARGILLAGYADKLVGERVNIAYGRMVTVRQVADTVLKVLGRNDLSVEAREARPGDVHQLHADTAKADRLLGYKAETSFEDGVRHYVDWIRARYPDPSVLIEAEVVNWTLPGQDRKPV